MSEMMEELKELESKAKDLYDDIKSLEVERSRVLERMRVLQKRNQTDNIPLLRYRLKKYEEKISTITEDNVRLTKENNSLKDKLSRLSLLISE